MSDKGSNDFIEVYDGALDSTACAALIRQFDASGDAVRGRAGSGVNTAVKNSWDITISGKPEWVKAESRLNRAMLEGLKHYLRKYPYTVLGPLWLKMKDDATGELTLLRPESLVALPDQRLGALAVRAFRPGNINIQKYIANEGGYPRWHCELHPQSGDPTGEKLHRTLLWTVYLNDGFAEGETEFLHQRRKIAPRTGSLLIAPTAFTHTHRGNMPKGGDKYIATSWILFQRSDALHRGAEVNPD
ncbi:MAG TPA: 2OG-Fe(II) oxygenase [Paraburkholderia sp.]|jgi:hypothetical protein